MVVILAVAGLVLEGGNAYAQQRISQNGADSAANAGAIVVARALTGAPGANDGAVFTAVNQAVAQHQLSTGDDLQAVQATYTDGVGALLGVPVGSGSIPAAARGVNVVGSRPVQSLFGSLNLFGLRFTSPLTATAQATAVAGVVIGPCPLDTDCGILPITPPVSISTTVCDEDGQSLGIGPIAWPTITDPEDAGQVTAANEAIVPLCKGPGNGDFALLDLDPRPGVNLRDEIRDPSGMTFYLPDWIRTQTGNASNSVEDDINIYRGSVVLIPMWDGICGIDPGDPDIERNPCPSDEDDPNGNNTWYHIPYLRAFLLDEAFTGGRDDECGVPPGNPQVAFKSPPGKPIGFLGCLKGWWITRYLSGGPISIGNDDIPEDAVLGIQLIK
jgi:hypothetical protein